MAKKRDENADTGAPAEDARYFVGVGATHIGVGDTGHSHDVSEDGYIDCEECAIALRGPGSDLGTVDTEATVGGGSIASAPETFDAEKIAAVMRDEIGKLAVEDVLEEAGTDVERARFMRDLEAGRGSDARAELLAALDEIIASESA